MGFSRRKFQEGGVKVVGIPGKYLRKNVNFEEVQCKKSGKFQGGHCKIDLKSRVQLDMNSICLTRGYKKPISMI